MHTSDNPSAPGAAAPKRAAPPCERPAPFPGDRSRAPHLIALALLALVSTLPFWISDLDIRAAAFYYEPGAEEAWPVSQEPLWTFVYQLSPLIAALVLLGGLGVLIAGSFTPQLRRLRPYALFVIAIYALGPGLLVNSLLKENWGRPRPHQLEQFGFSKSYLPPLMPGVPGDGKSFPCGHSSVGYALSAFFLIWLRRRPRLAAAALLVAVGLGTLVGIGRMTAGDHFLSDILWSGVIVYGLALLLYYPVLKIPRHEATWDLQRGEAGGSMRELSAGAIGTYLAVAAAMITGVLLATPVAQQAVFAEDVADLAPPSSETPRVLRIAADTASLVLYWPHRQEATRSAVIRLKARGFGLPGTRVEHVRASEGHTVTYRFRHQGVFTEKDTKLIVGVRTDDWDRIELTTQVGDIRVHETSYEVPELRLVTGKGTVLQPQSLVSRRQSPR